MRPPLPPTPEVNLEEVPREDLLAALEHAGIPEHLLALVEDREAPSSFDSTSRELRALARALLVQAARVEGLLARNEGRVKNIVDGALVARVNRVEAEVAVLRTSLSAVLDPPTDDYLVIREEAKRALVETAHTAQEHRRRAFDEGIIASADAIDEAAKDPIHLHPVTMGWCSLLLRTFTNPSRWRRELSPLHLRAGFVHPMALRADVFHARGNRCTLRAGHDGPHLRDPSQPAGGECGATIPGST